MKRFALLFSVFLIPIVSFSQVNKSGYSNFKWGQSKESISQLKNCNNVLSGSDFSNCDIISKDSLFNGKYKYQFANLRFYKSQLSEIQFDLKHSDIGNIIADLSKEFGNPIIKEKKYKALDEENQSTGYVWIVGDTEIFIINDGTRMPAICILSSLAIKLTYPENTLSLEKLIFE